MQYDFPFRTSPGSSRVVAGRRISFSSYPGVPYSGDDYYAISSGLVVQETHATGAQRTVAESCGAVVTDPRARPWYRSAKAKWLSSSVLTGWSTVYEFSSAQTIAM